MHVIRSHVSSPCNGTLPALEIAAECSCHTEPDFPAGRPARLSPREVECLEWLARGLLDERIAERIGISCSTVRLHLKNARVKLGAKTREQALVIAVQRSLIRP